MERLSGLDVLKVRQLPPGEIETRAKWDDFVTSCPAATFFHLSGWQRVIKDVFRHPTYFLYAEREERIVGVLPLAHVRSVLFGRTLVSLPFAVYGGVAALDQEAIDALDDAAQELARKLKVDHLEMRNRAVRHPERPRQNLYVTFRKELSPDPEENLRRIPRKQRAMVRKGIANGLVARTDSDVRSFFALFADNAHRHGTPVLPIRYFDALVAEFGENCEILLVYDSGGTPLSGAMSFYFRDEVLPYYAGDFLAARAVAANDFKYWELMRRACQRGVRLFDYGRSKRGTGSFAFKKNWGFEPQDLHYEYCLFRRDKVPQNNPNNPKYKLLIEAWRALPISVANRLGPYIVRNLG